MLNRLLTFSLFFLVGLILVEGVYYMRERSFQLKKITQTDNFPTITGSSTIINSSSITSSGGKYQKDGIKAVIGEVQNSGLVLIINGEKKYYQYAGKLYIYRSTDLQKELKADILKAGQKIEFRLRKDNRLLFIIIES